MEKMVDGVAVPLTADEIAARQAEEQEWADKQWEREMAKTDKDLTRFMEDTMDAVGVENYPQSWQDKNAAKKAKRAEKPEQ